MKSKAAKKEPAGPSPRDKFIRLLAEYFTTDQARRSIELGMGKESAADWARLRGATPIMGYIGTDMAEGILREFLLGRRW